jgi:uncharacterized membrane protein
MVLGVGILSIFTALLGGPLGVGFLMLGGLMIMGALTFYWVILGISAYAAYAGRTNKLPIVGFFASKIESRIKRRLRTV